MNTDESDVIRRLRVATNYHCIFNIVCSKKNINNKQCFWGKKKNRFSNGTRYEEKTNGQMWRITHKNLHKGK